MSPAPLSWQRLMLAGALLWTLSIGTLQAFAIPEFRPYDERAHVAYALSLADGQLPTIRSRIPLVRLGIRGGKDRIFTANHPPLYYAVVAGPIALGEAWGPRAAVVFGRLATLLLTVMGLGFVYATVRQLLPKRVELAVAVTAWTASCPSLVHISSLVHNDALAFASCTATLWAGTRLCMLGFSAGSVATLALAGLAAVLTRLSGFFALVPTLFFVAGVLLFVGDEPLKGRLKRALIATGAAGFLVLVGAGWFYARNYSLYGDVAGASAILDQFHRRPRGSLDSVWFNGDLWANLVRQIWGRMAGGVKLKTPSVYLGIAVMAAGAMIFLAGLWRSRAQLLSDRRRLIITSGYALAFSLFLLSIFAYYARGGTPSVRYLLPVIWIPWLAFAWGFCTVDARIALLAPVLGAGLSAILTCEYLRELLGKGQAELAWERFGDTAFSGAVLSVTGLMFVLGTLAYLWGWKRRLS